MPATKNLKNAISHSNSKFNRTRQSPPSPFDQPASQILKSAIFHSKAKKLKMARHHFAANF
jgi:hypothetical protein